MREVRVPLSWLQEYVDIPWDGEELAERLSSRKTESASDLAVRLNTAGQEMREVCNFDYVVFNRHNQVDEAIAEILAIMKAEKCRVIPRNIEL